MRLYLIRHGETEYNSRGIMQGYSEVPLNDAGIDQASRLGRRVATMPLDRIVSSDLRRAAMTASILAAHTGAPLSWDVGFRERDPGELSGLPHDQSEGFFTDPDYVPPGGEGVPEFSERVRAAFATLVKAEAGKDNRVAVVSHGMVCGAFLIVCLGKTREEIAGTHWPNTCLTVADYNGSWKLISQGDASHLEDAETAQGHAAGA